MRKQCFEKEYEGLLLFGFVFFGCASRGLKRLPQQQGAGEGTAPAEEGQQPVQQNSLACYHSVQNNLWLRESSEPSKLILLFQWNCFSFNVSRLSLLLGCWIPHGFHAVFTPDPLPPNPWKQTSPQTDRNPLFWGTVLKKPTLPDPRVLEGLASCVRDLARSPPSPSAS